DGPPHPPWRRLRSSPGGTGPRIFLLFRSWRTPFRFLICAPMVARQAAFVKYAQSCGI
ncbi:KTSC domain-containing protein, partial [Dysosmobacter welbionis]